MWWVSNQPVRPKPCGSELAREGVPSVENVLPAPPLSGASPLLHWFCGGSPITRLPAIPCGSEPAREGVPSAENVLPAPPLSGASPLPHWFCGGSPITRLPAIPCGSEPARESGLSVPYVLADSPPSRAGSLLQWFCVVLEIQLCSALRPRNNASANAGNTATATAERFQPKCSYSGLATSEPRAPPTKMLVMYTAFRRARLCGSRA